MRLIVVETEDSTIVVDAYLFAAAVVKGGETLVWLVGVGQPIPLSSSAGRALMEAVCSAMDTESDSYDS